MDQVTQINAQETEQLLGSIQTIIECKGQQVAIYLNNSVNQLYWEIGSHIIGHIQYQVYSDYGKRILATLSQKLTARFTVWPKLVEGFIQNVLNCQHCQEHKN